jgi:hypothetical protein
MNELQLEQSARERGGEKHKHPIKMQNQSLRYVFHYNNVIVPQFKETTTYQYISTIDNPIQRQLQSHNQNKGVKINKTTNDKRKLVA